MVPTSPLSGICSPVVLSSSGIRRHWQIRWWTAARAHPNVVKTTKIHFVSQARACAASLRPVTALRSPFERFSSASDLRPTTKEHEDIMWSRFLCSGIKNLDLLLGYMDPGSITGDCDPFGTTERMSMSITGISRVISCTRDGALYQL